MFESFIQTFWQKFSGQTETNKTVQIIFGNGVVLLFAVYLLRNVIKTVLKAIFKGGNKIENKINNIEKNEPPRPNTPLH